MKYRANAWLDTRTMDIHHSIDALHEGSWLPCAEDGKPLFFDTEEDRDAKLKALRKESRKVS